MHKRPFGLALDHLAVTAPDLAAGAAHVAEALGIAPGPGGSHAAMGSHNRLLALGPAEYLEAIAPDPAAPPPGRARFFALDARQPPRLAHWIARVDDIEAAMAASPVPTGPALAMSRGPLRWRLTVPEDGHLPMGGIFPSLIEWPGGTHPAAAMPASGCRLLALDLEGPDADLLAPWLAAHCGDPRIRVHAGGACRLRATIETPQGPRVLG